MNDMEKKFSESNFKVKYGWILKKDQEDTKQSFIGMWFPRRAIGKCSLTRPQASLMITLNHC